jgi:hypothetical protein
MIDNYLVVVKLFFRGGAFALLLAHPFLKTYQPAIHKERFLQAEYGIKKK